MASNPANARGFSLVELIVAGVVAAIVVATIGTSISQIARARTVAKVRLNSHLRANAALERVRRELQQAIRSDEMVDTRVLLQSDMVESPVGELDRDEILIYATKLTPIREKSYSGDGIEQEVQCRVEEDAAGSALWIRSDAVPDENEGGGGKAVPVMEGVVGMNIEASDGVQWYDEWDSDINGLPHALRVTISTGGDPDGVDLFEEVHDLMSLRTVVALDRTIPPYEPPVEEGTELGEGSEMATDADAAAAAAAAAAASAITVPGGAAGGGSGALGPTEVGRGRGDMGGPGGRGRGDFGGAGGRGGRGGGGIRPGGQGAPGGGQNRPGGGFGGAPN